MVDTILFLYTPQVHKLVFRKKKKNRTTLKLVSDIVVINCSHDLIGLMRLFNFTAVLDCSSKSTNFFCHFSFLNKKKRKS